MIKRDQYVRVVEEIVVGSITIGRSMEHVVIRKEVIEVDVQEMYNTPKQERSIQAQLPQERYMM